MFAGQMSQPAQPDLTFEAFQWADAFSTHLCSMGAPNPQGELFELGRQLFLEYSELDPSEVPETVWAKWSSKGDGSSAP